MFILAGDRQTKNDVYQQSIIVYRCSRIGMIMIRHDQRVLVLRRAVLTCTEVSPFGYSQPLLALEFSHSQIKPIHQAVAVRQLVY